MNEYRITIRLFVKKLYTWSFTFFFNSFFFSSFTLFVQFSSISPDSLDRYSPDNQIIWMKNSNEKFRTIRGKLEELKKIKTFVVDELNQV